MGSYKYIYMQFIYTYIQIYIHILLFKNKITHKKKNQILKN